MMASEHPLALRMSLLTSCSVLLGFTSGCAVDAGDLQGAAAPVASVGEDPGSDTVGQVESSADGQEPDGSDEPIAAPDPPGDSVAVGDDASDDPTDDAVDDVDGTVAGIPVDDDLSDPGLPVDKRSYLIGLEQSQGPGDHFDFDEDSHWLRTSQIHGTDPSIAIDRTVLASGEGPTADDFAAFVESAFHAAWHVFGGFPFDRYAVRIRAEDGSDDFSLSPVGVTLSGADYAAPWMHEVVAHEMFHSWNGKFILPEPDASENLFQWETWLVEGGTVYYSFRHLGFALDEREYHNGMAGRWEAYLEYVGTPNDLSVPELIVAIGSASPGDPSTQDPTNMLYARGAMVSYMLDQELAGLGHCLDDVMHQLYADALNGATWSPERLADILRSLTARDFQPFLDEWIDSNALLPLDGAFELRE